MRPSAHDSSVFIAEAGLSWISREDVEFLKRELARQARLRVRLCSHPSLADKIQEMLIVLKREGYVRPHKHLAKTESLHILEGRADAVIFEDDGRVAELVPMGDYASGLKFFYRMSEPRYHTLVLKTDYLVFKETANGPFDRKDALFPDWAPSAPDSEEGRRYLRGLVK